MPPASRPPLPDYDALLVVSFGGPDGPDEVIPFLENVTRGRNVPRARLLEVAEHYQHFGGRSPINEQNRQLVAAIERELAAQGPQLPVYWGNRNWHPLLPDTLRQMAHDGVRRALAFVTSAFSSYSGCRQYREDIVRAQQGVGPAAPQVDKLRVFFNHPGFIEPMAESTRAALTQIPSERQTEALVVFTAHSIPLAMAENCRYEEQLREACRLVASRIDRDDWHLVYQSRSGPPGQPWLEPDINDFLAGLKRLSAVSRRLSAREAFWPIADSREPRADADPRPLTPAVVLVPIGFISDHMEVVYDLDTEARATCDDLGIHMIHAATVGTHPRFVQMIRELVEERMTASPQRLALGTLGPSHDVCPDDCCLYVPGRPKSD